MVLYATVEPQENAQGKLFWLLHIKGLGLPYTVERTFAISTDAEREARAIAKSCHALLDITTLKLVR
jgi:hypothetical protein